jgi:hypothetical protein
MSCPFRVMLGLSGETFSSRSKTLGLPRPLDQAIRATWHTTSSKVSIKRWVTSRVIEVMSWVLAGFEDEPPETEQTDAQKSEFTDSSRSIRPPFFRISIPPGHCNK